MRCPVCDKVLRLGDVDTCPACAGLFRYPQGNLCSQCGKPIAESETYCTNCRHRTYTYISGRSAFLYTGAVQESVARFKYGGRQEYGAYYGKMLWKRQGGWISRIAPDILVPVPLHRSRYRSRGYNQAQILAERLGEYAGIPVAGLLVRVKKTLPQKELTLQERERNLCHAFQIDICVKQLYENAKCAILIDDIYTTGSTAEMCSRILYEAGIEKVYVLSLCIGKDS